MNGGILSAVGNTPLVKLDRTSNDLNVRVFAKLESLNPAGSIKDRTAVSIIRNGVESGAIRPGTTIIESSSGNMGIGLAQACAYLGFKLICVIDPKTTRQNINILKSYGAQIDYVSEPDPQTGEYLQARINRVKTLLDTIENSFWPDQYSNLYNAYAHYQTMREMIEVLNRIDYLFCATSTCGTLRGCAEYIRKESLPTKIFAVDAVGSVIFGSESAKRIVPGHGAAIRPKLFQPDLADEVVLVTDLECVVGCRHLVRTEAILAGGSSGAVYTAFHKAQARLHPDSTCVLIFPDRGERYMDTIYSDDWVEETFGDAFSLCQNPGAPQISKTARM